MKRVLLLPLKVVVYVFATLIMLVGWVFVSKRGKEEPDTTWETGRKRIYDLGIGYWEKELEKLNLKQNGIDILEVGSGNGQWLIAFSEFANRVEGVEPGEAIIEYSKQKFKEYGVEDRVKVHQAFAEKLPQEDKAFDLVFCAGVFMFTKQKEALKEFNRVLKDDGKVLVTVNGLGYFVMHLLNGMRYLSLQKTIRGLKGISNTIMKWMINRQVGMSAVSHTEMKEMLKECGFELLETRIWVAQELYPLEHLGFVTNYSFLAKKVG